MRQIKPGTLKEMYDKMRAAVGDDFNGIFFVHPRDKDALAAMDEIGEFVVVSDKNVPPGNCYLLNSDSPDVLPFKPNPT